MPKPIRWAVLILLLILAVSFALANRQAIEVRLDPFGAEPPLLRMPLFVAIFFFMLLGVLIGGAAAWLGQAKWRRRARERAREVEGLSREIAELRAGRGLSHVPTDEINVLPPV